MTHTGRAFVKMHPNTRVAAFASFDPCTENQVASSFF